jgi:acylglycerol lipase
MSRAPLPPPGMARRAVLLGGLAAGCTPAAAPPGPGVREAGMDGEAFIMPDGMLLPYRAWRPGGDTAPWAAALALHGFNDSRDAWDLPGPAFAEAGVALYAPDQRGFGATTARGLWPGADALADDALTMLALIRRRHPEARIYAVGESMGGAVLMHAATRGTALPVDGFVLLAPAVWGRASMNWFMQGGLWLAATLTPGLTVSRPPPAVRIIASDNDDALRALGRNPLTIKTTRFDTLRGLVDLMDLALAAAPRFPAAPSLFLYGAHDMIIPSAATRRTWERLPQAPVRRARYEKGYHLLLRDLERAVPTADIIAWMQWPGARLPSNAEAAAAAWMGNGA